MERNFFLKKKEWIITEVVSLFRFNRMIFCFYDFL